MRSRTVREGSVGLLILVGLALFGGLTFWIRGLTLGNRTYTIFVEFINTNGMQIGAPVRYRGVTVGNIKNIEAAANRVEVVVEISSADLRIPSNAIVEANQSGFLSETSIDITPLQAVPPEVLTANPLADDCNSQVIVCDNDRLPGQIGVSFDALIRNSNRFAELYSDPAFFNNINSAARNAGVAAAGVAQLSSDLSQLSRAVRQEVNTFSTTANSINQAAAQTSAQVSIAANRISNTADQYSATATQLNELAANANDLIVSNRSTLVRTLDSVTQTSDQLRATVTSLDPTIARISTTVNGLNASAGRLNIDTLLQNLETLSTNAAQASTTLRDFSDPANVLVLQQTLDSARVTFENAQKITSDLDELTGDPTFRNNLKELVNGLSTLVSTTEQLEQQTQVAQQLESVYTAINYPVPTPANKSVKSNSKASRALPKLNTQKQSKLMPAVRKKPERK
jgi:phospholipid/cholesterol/gamma-HCH transport system substrate-binding protein